MTRAKVRMSPTSIAKALTSTPPRNTVTEAAVEVVGTADLEAAAVDAVVEDAADAGHARVAAAAETADPHKPKRLNQ